MPYPYTYFNPNKKEQLALGAGSLISALLGAASGQNGSDAALRGLAGLTGGYGAGYQNYQDLMNNAFQRDINERRYNQDVNQDAFRNDLASRQFDQNIREYEEIDKGYKQAIINSMDRKLSPEQQKYDNEMARTKLAQEKNQLALSRNKLRGNSPEDMLNKHQSANIAHNIRNEIRLNPYVKDFQDVNQKYNVMQQALEESKNTGTLIAADQALITLFNKMTDPSSVVRESEYARTQSDQGILNRIAGKANKIMSGGAGLMPEEREALVRMAGKFYDIYKTNYDKTIADFTQLGTESGINPNLVNIPFKRKKDAMEELIDLAKSGDQEAIQYLQSKGLNK